MTKRLNALRARIAADPERRARVAKLAARLRPELFVERGDAEEAAREDEHLVPDYSTGTR